MAAGDYTPDVLLTAEVLVLLGKKPEARESLEHLLRTKGFPQAAGAFSRGRFWHVDDIEAWAKDNGYELHPQALDEWLDRVMQEPSNQGKRAKKRR